jgi:rSAM/selenodomain-associated transferase 1
MVTEAGATVALFTRAPVAGAVKSRLAQRIGAEAALALHRELLARTIAALRGHDDFRLVLYVAGDVSLLAGEGVACLAQCEGDLGARMAAAVADITASGRIAVIVGGDCPLLSAADVRAAVVAVRSGADVAIVPAEDGGYVLIAMAALHQTLFEGIDWGTSRVFATTCDRARQARLQLVALEALWDVDDLEGLARYRALRSASPCEKGSE